MGGFQLFFVLAFASSLEYLQSALLNVFRLALNAMEVKFLSLLLCVLVEQYSVLFFPFPFAYV